MQEERSRNDILDWRNVSNQDIHIQEALEMKNVKRIYADWKSLNGQRGDDVTRIIQENKDMEVLSLRNAGMKNTEVTGVLQAIRNHAHLKRLDISYPRLGGYNEEIMHQLRSFLWETQSLKELCLEAFPVNDEGVEILVHRGLDRNETLEHLSLARNGLTVGGCEILASFLYSRNRSWNLLSLDLSFNQICNSGAETLGRALTENQTLQNLDIRHNSIGDEGLIALGEGLQINFTLRQLSLWGNNFGQQSSSLFHDLCQNRFVHLGLQTDILPYLVDSTFYVACNPLDSP